MDDETDTIGRRYELLRGHLTELQRRLFLGAEAAQRGSGGVQVVAEAAGVSADTVRRGRDELAGLAVPGPGRSRKPGGGRKRAEDLDAGLVTALEALIEPTTRGDPESPLRWTTLSTRALARTLTEQGHRVSDYVVRRLLKEQGYSLQSNAKTIEGTQHPDRDGQFAYLGRQVAHHQEAGQPTISVDAKKKELVGAYENKGAEWRPAGDPEQVKVHDFIDPDLGKANPYGVYDVAANTGWVAVGTDHDTAAFAVNTIRSWWSTTGRVTYPDASRLLVTADGGGSNGDRTRAFKTELADLAAQTGLSITVCHLPPGTSKWNKIEARHEALWDRFTPLVLPYLDELAWPTPD